MRSNYISCGLQGGYHFSRNLLYQIIIQSPSGSGYLHPIDIDFDIIIVREFQIESLFTYIITQIKAATYPNVSCIPGCFTVGITICTEGSHPLLPSGRLIIGCHPVACWFCFGIYTFPFHTCRRFQYRKQRYLLPAHEPIRFSIHPYPTQQRERFAGPMFSFILIQFVRKRPGTGIRINGYQRISRCT